jgi:hypothetical protein
MPLTIRGLPIGLAAAYPFRKCHICGSENNELRLAANADAVEWVCGECGNWFKDATKADLLAFVNYYKHKR